MEKVMAIVEGEVVVDYAYPCMMAERALKNLHNAMLENNYEAAMDYALQAIADCRMTYQAIRDTFEKVV
jgi:hypothetical protein